MSRIIIELNDDINSFEVQDMIDSFLLQPYVKTAFIEQCCGKCSVKDNIIIEKEKLRLLIYMSHIQGQRSSIDGDANWKIARDYSIEVINDNTFDNVATS